MLTTEATAPTRPSPQRLVFCPPRRLGLWACVLMTLCASLIRTSSRMGKAPRLCPSEGALLQTSSVVVKRVMADNDACYKSKAFAAAGKAPGLRQIRTNPLPPGPMASSGAAYRPPCAPGPGPIKQHSNGSKTCQNGRLCTVRQTLWRDKTANACQPAQY